MPTSGKKHFRNSAQQHAKPQENTLVIRTGCGTGMRNDALAMLRRDVASGAIRSTEQAMNMLPMAQRNAYNRLAGEAESRLTEVRIDMSPAERAAQYPWAEDYFKQATGVSKGALIHRGGLLSDGPALSVGKADIDVSYRGSHSAPSAEFGAPLNDMTRGMYPDDFYSQNGLRYYGSGSDGEKEAFAIAQKVRGKPDAMVTAYRAVPKGVQSELNAGDWIATSKAYAKQHGESVLNGDYDIISQKVPAKHIYTNADSISEYGYDPTGLGIQGGTGSGTNTQNINRFETEADRRMAAAQRNAALPFEQGGLGLPADNTPMDRARAMGFDTEFQHGSGTGNITAFDLLETQKSDPGYLGQAIYGGPIGMKAYTGGGNVYPLLAKSENMQKITPENWNNNSPYSEVSDLFSKDFGNRDKIAQEYTKGKLNKGVTGIIDTSNGKGLEQIAVFDPKNIRSRFAAFDPFNRDSSNLLAQSAKLAPTTALGAYMYNEKRKKSQGKQ